MRLRDEVLAGHVEDESSVESAVRSAPALAKVFQHAVDVAFVVVQMHRDPDPAALIVYKVRRSLSGFFGPV